MRQKIKFLIASVVMLGGITGCTYNYPDSYAAPAPEYKKRVVHDKWKNGVHMKIIRTKKCSPDGYCRVKKRTVYLNRNWPDKVVFKG